MNRARFVHLAVALALGAVSPARAQSPDWTAFLTVRPNPSPYIADWQSDPSVVTLVLSYGGNADVPFYLNGQILRGSVPVVTGTSTEFEFVRPSQLLLTTRDGIWETNSVTYPQSLRDQLTRTGRIPDGDYQFCVDVRQGLPESGIGTLLAHTCADFSIVSPQPPSLMVPQDGDTVVAGLPTFVWTPVVAGFNVAVTYHLRVAAVLPGQSPIDAINNIPQFEEDLSNTARQFPPTALPLEDSARYVWQVQALDAVGQPLGERQGKSEIFAFTYRAFNTGPIVMATDTTADTTGREERPVAQFMWGPIQVKVASLTDSSRSNYSGRGRAVLVAGLLEPSFSFKSVHLDSSGARVAFAPRHVVSLPTGTGAVNYALKHLPLPFYLNVTTLVLTADSASGDRHAGISGAGEIFLGVGVADSVLNVEPDTTIRTKWDCSPDTTAKRVDHTATVCTAAGKDSSKTPSAWDTYKALESRSLYFTFDDLHLDPTPAGTITLGQDYTTGIFGLPDAQLKLLADSTNLVMADGGATLTLAGEFQLPASAGLARDTPDTTRYKITDKPDSITIDTSVTLKFSSARLGTNGEFYFATTGLPHSHIGQTGVHVQTGGAWIDFSSALSPPGKATGWQGVYFDSARVELPADWKAQNSDSTAAFVGYGLSVDGGGFSGDVYGTDLARLGRVDYAGFQGKLDSLHFKFIEGTLDTGYVQGALKLPFMDDDIDYWVNFTPVGVGQAYAQIKTQQPINMSAIHAKAVIQRGEFVYNRPLGTFTMDAKLTIDQDNIALREVQVYGLSISSDGALKLQGGWLALDGANQGSFKNFPLAVDSIGFGSGTSGNEVWVGLAGRFALNDNLPSAVGSFRFFAGRQAVGSPWSFTRLAVDKLDMSYQNAAVAFKGSLDYLDNDPVYGNGFKAAVAMSVQNQFKVNANFLVGATTGTSAARSFRYWYVDAKLLLPPPGIQLGTLPLALYGFGGGAYARMRAHIDTATLTATYIPDSTTAFGLKALLTFGASAGNGYIWNADAQLEATVGTSGGLSSLTLRGDNWMLTEVSQRQKRIWGTVLINLPVSQPVFQANMSLNVNLKPALSGSGWAELHFDPSLWYLHVGTEARPDSLVYLPGVLNLTGTSYFLMNATGVDAGFGVFLQQEKTVGMFYGKVSGGFAATAEMRYRPFMAMGDGELWGDIVAKVKGYTLLNGTARATLAFRLPDPTRIWGKVSLHYSLLSGVLKGTYKMNYSWGSGGNEASDTAQFVMVASTYPVSGDTAATLTGVSYYLGMSEGTEYGTDNGVYRLRLSGTPTLSKVVFQTVTARNPRTGATVSQIVASPVALGAVGNPIVRDWDAERSTLTLKAPGAAILDPATTYRSTTVFVLEKAQSDGSWSTIQTVTSTVQYRTSGQVPTIGQLVTAADPPGGSSPLYYGGANRGAVRVQFSNTTTALTSGAVVGQLLGGGTDTVAGRWGTSYYALAIRAMTAADPTLWAFSPTAGALAPSTSYRFSLVNADTTHAEQYGVSFVTSRYATLADHVHGSTTTVTVQRGSGPVSGSGNYLLGAQVVLASPEAISWNDIDSIDVTGVSANWQVTPHTRCLWAGGGGPKIASLGIGVRQMCGSAPTYENVLDISFNAAADASLPAASTASVTVRLNHHREGWQTFTFAFPPPPIIATPIIPRTTTPAPPTVVKTVDVTRARVP